MYGSRYNENQNFGLNDKISEIDNIQATQKHKVVYKEH